MAALSYTSGRHLTFYEAAEPIQQWRRAQRAARRVALGPEHLLASSAIPFLFPAVPLEIDGCVEYFGDGSIRQIAPLSPAIHFGAERIVVLGAAAPRPEVPVASLEASAAFRSRFRKRADRARLSRCARSPRAARGMDRDGKPSAGARRRCCAG